MITRTYVIGFILFFIHSYLFTLLAKNYTDKERFPVFVRIAVCIFNACLSGFIINLLFENQSLAYTIISIIIIAEVIFLFEDHIWGLVGIAFSILIHFSASRSIILGTHSIFIDNSMYNIVNSYDLSLLNTYLVIAFHIMLIFTVIVVIPVSAVRVIVKSRVFLPYILIIMLVLQAFFIFNVTIFSINIHNNELTLQQIILPCLLLGIFYVVLIFMIMLIKAENYRKIIAELESKTEIDELTGAYNKAAIKTRVSQSLNDGKMGALFVFDIDNFKSINDTLGHAYGDKMLSEVHESIKSIVRREDFIGRFGGDEFVVFVKECVDVEKISRIGSAFCRVLEKIHTSPTGEDIIVSASIGIAVSPKDGKTYDELFINADTALYISKNKGKNTFTIYEKGMKAF